MADYTNMFGYSAHWSGQRNHRRDSESFFNPQSCKSSFDLPYPSEKLFLLSRGPIGGSVRIVQSPDRSQNEGVVRVEVIAKCQYVSDLDHVGVSRISRREGNENGVGIFAQQSRNSRNIDFDVTMYLPMTSSESSPLHVKNLETDLPLFAHYIGYLADTVDFDTVTFNTSNMPIEVGSLYATKARMQTSNSYIEGYFEISSSLELSTANSHIKAKVDLFNDENMGVSDVIMSTTNGPIDATLALVSTASNYDAVHSDIGGRFKVSATTALSPVDITFLRAPVDSVLILDTCTSLSAATIKLPETYEGRFSLTTTWNRPEVVVDNTVRDPKGAGRRRTVNVDNGVGAVVSGTARWGTGRRTIEGGAVNVGTSWAPVTLKF